MKKVILNSSLILGLSLLMTSCYTYTAVVGEGSQTGTEVEKKNHYLIYGLVPIEVSNSKEMAGGSENYELTIEHTFVDGLLQAITFGIYAPTTTTVRK